MIRTLFSAAGFSMTWWGASLFYVESLTLKKGTPIGSLLSLITYRTGQGDAIAFSQWLPHTLIGVGVVTIMYAIALPKASSAHH